MWARDPLPGEHLGSVLADDQQPREGNPTTRRLWDFRPCGPGCGSQHASGEGFLLLPHSQEAPLLDHPRSMKRLFRVADATQARDRGSASSTAALQVRQGRERG